MGNCLKKAAEAAPAEEAPKYSWDQRKVDVSQLVINNITGSAVVRKPGVINGEQVSIDKCKDADIFILDNVGGAFVDNCTNCFIFIGPAKGSVFLRNCSNCKCIILCQQFRARDCSDVDISLCCATLPIIEASSAVQFSCLRGSYFEMNGQLSAAGLSPYVNYWSRIHDFSPASGGGRNYSLSTDVPSWLPEMESKLAANGFPVDFAAAKCIVPITTATALSESNESCLVIIFAPTANYAKKFTRQVSEASKDGVGFTCTKEYKMSIETCRAIFGDDEKYSTALAKGPVVGFELRGNGCKQIAEAACTTIEKATLFITTEKKNISLFNEAADRLIS